MCGALKTKKILRTFLTKLNLKDQKIAAFNARSIKYSAIHNCVKAIRLQKSPSSFIELIAGSLESNDLR